MKLNKFFLGLFCATALLTACSDDDDYQWAPMSGGNQVYFSNTLPTTINLSRGESSFNIPVSRVDSVAAGSYSVSLTTESKFITAPANVSFNAGQRVANITLNYLTDSLKYDDFQKATLTITDEANVNEYGAKSYTFSFGIPSPYVSIGRGTFTDNYWFEGGARVEIMQNSENPSVFRIMAPFDAIANTLWADDGGAAENLDGNQSPYVEITILKPGDTTYGVEITQNDLVTYSDICTGYFHSSYEADVYMLYPGRFTSMADEGSFLYNHVIEWQANGLPGRIQLAPYYYMFGVGGWNKTQNDGMVIIDFPGYDPKDYSIEMENLGVLTDLAGSAYATIVATLGEDASDVRAVVVSSDADVDEVGAALATAGEGEYTAISDGNNFIPIPEGLTGKLSVVVAVVDDGETKEVFVTEFEYWGGGANPWETVGTGDFVYTLFFGEPDDPAVDEGLEMQYSADEDVYRIQHWGYDVDFTFKFDKATNAVTVPSQFTGYTHSSYGPVFIQESDDYAAAQGAWDDDDEDGTPDPNDGPSYYDPETQTFHFSLCYYVSAGYFIHGVETYTLTAAEARALGLNTKQMPKANTSLKPAKVKKSVGKKTIISRLLLK